ncbi:MAG TPA: polysaccharide deacetylase family protein [Steroidobacteraceae bacterium]
MKLALKIDVDTFVGTQVGVPALAELCERHGARATFLFSLGPDHTGRALRRVLRPGFLSKVRRTSVLEHYGLKTLLYGTLLPGPDIGRRCAAILRGIRDRGFEVGIHTFDHVRWQDFVARKGASWTRREMQRAVERFTEVFGVPPRVHGAAGWQMNAHAFELEDALGFQYASDTRGFAPFYPRLGARTLACLQMPTTLPTLDELIGRPDLGQERPVDYLLRLTDPQREGQGRDHVFTLHAELEGRRLAPWLEELLAGWRSQGYRLTSLGDYHAALDRAGIPAREVIYAEVPGRSGALAVEKPSQQ